MSGEKQYSLKKLNKQYSLKKRPVVSIVCHINSVNMIEMTDLTEKENKCLTHYCAVQHCTIEAFHTD